MKHNLLEHCIFPIKSRILWVVLIQFLFLSGFTQTSCNFNLNCKQKPLEEVLQSLRDQCDLVFSYNPDAIPLKEKITLNLRQNSLREALNQLGERCGIGYYIRGNRVVLFRDKKKRQIVVNGFVVDQESGEKLIAARVMDLRSGRGILTNEYGFFSLKLPADSVSLLINYATYKNLRIPLLLKRSTQLKIELSPDYELGEVEIVAEEIKAIEGDMDPAELSISIREMKALPSMLGEVDVVKSIQLLPGVQAGREGSSGLYIRGGGPDQNLVLLDGVPLYYVSHLGGFFSIFNPDALNGINLIKGGFPARYGGRLSSVLDVHMKEGNMKKWQGAGSLGLLTGKLSFEGPLKKDKSSFIISARRSYLDLIVSPIVNKITDNSAKLGYVFYDLNAKMNYWLSPKDRFYLSLYSGHDKTVSSFGYERVNIQPGLKEKITQKTSNLIKWGNNLMAARWNHIWSPRLFSNMTATYGYYNYKLHNDHAFSYEEEISGRRSHSGFNWRFNSGIQDVGLKLDFDFYPHPRHKMKFGIGSLYHQFQPGFARIRFLSDFEGFEELDYQSDSSLIRSLESSVYIEDKWKIHKNIRLQAGLHAVHYKVGKSTYPSIQPRLSIFWRLRKNVQMKAAYASMAQYVHLLTNPGVDLPSDRWVPATENIPPQQSQQLSLGTWWQPGNNGISIGLEGYYKKLTNLITYQSAEDFYNQAVKWQDFVEKEGIGEAYGVEFLARKSKGKTTGWVAYTLSWNYRQFENLNGGNPFPYRYDRRHDVNLTLVHQFSDRVGLSGSWVFGTGNAITLTTGIHNSWMQDNGQISPFNLGGGIGLPPEERNGIRMGNYHRLDVSLQLTKKTSWGERSWHFGLFNAYNRKNPYYYFFQVGLGRNPAGQLLPEIRLMQYNLFGILPAISYHFSF